MVRSHFASIEVNPALGSPCHALLEDPRGTYVEKVKYSHQYKYQHECQENIEYYPILLQ